MEWQAELKTRCGALRFMTVQGEHPPRVIQVPLMPKFPTDHYLDPDKTVQLVDEVRVFELRHWHREILTYEET